MIRIQQLGQIKLFNKKKMRVLLFLSIFGFSTSWLSATELDNFYGSQHQNVYTCLGSSQKINYELLLPRDFEMVKKNQKLPLFVVFDMQNKSIYKNALNTIDYLSSLNNLPSSCIMGVGFNDGMQRFTLSQYSADNQGLETFLTDTKTLIDQLIQLHSINVSNIILIGHSRTGYIASQFLFNYPEYITAAIVGSSQDVSTKKEIQIVEKFINTIEEKKLKRYFLFSSGLEKWGDGDEEQTTNLIRFFDRQKSKFLIAEGQQFKCDHNSSLGYALTANISKLFLGYNYAFQEGFNLINSGTKSIYLKEDYEKIYQRISDSTGINVDLDIIFYISFFYAYLNDYSGHYQENKLLNARAVLTEGMAKYESDYRFILHYITLLIEEGKLPEAKNYLSENLSKFHNFEWESQENFQLELNEILDFFKSE
jgi:pimeloyl-ACP methyl ester carboxylesterase